MNASFKFKDKIKQIDSIQTVFKFDKRKDFLGKGAFADVVKAKYTVNNQYYAMKIIKKNLIESKKVNQQLMKAEIETL